MDRGEIAAIGLAIELGAQWILMDELAGRKVARELGLRVIGVGGILLQAKKAGLIPAVTPILDLLRTQGRFWLSDNVYHEIQRLADE